MVSEKGGTLRSGVWKPSFYLIDIPNAGNPRPSPETATRQGSRTPAAAQARQVLQERLRSIEVRPDQCKDLTYHYGLLEAPLWGSSHPIHRTPDVLDVPCGVEN